MLDLLYMESLYLEGWSRQLCRCFEVNVKTPDKFRILCLNFVRAPLQHSVQASCLLPVDRDGLVAFLDTTAGNSKIFMLILNI